MSIHKDTTSFDRYLSSWYNSDGQSNQKNLKRVKTKMANTPKTHFIGRGADDGRFTTVEKARNHPKDHVVERLPNPGFGDTDSGKKKK